MNDILKPNVVNFLKGDREVQALKISSPEAQAWTRGKTGLSHSIPEFQKNTQIQVLGDWHENKFAKRGQKNHFCKTRLEDEEVDHWSPACQYTLPP